MLSIKLVQLIEAEWEKIAAQLIRAIRKHPDISHLSARTDLELREWCWGVLTDLNYSLSGGKDEEVTRRFRVLGRTRFDEQIPLHEAILRLQLLKDKLIGFIHDQGLPTTAMELYSEEELEQRIDRFFDALTYQLVRGYEDAERVKVRVA